MTQTETRGPAPARWARYAAAALAAAAGLIHFWVAPEHFEEAFEFGVFMVAVGLAQFALAVLLLLRPSRAVAVVGVAGSAVVFVVYVLSRTTGLPVGPMAGRPEEVQAIDVVSKVVELLLVLLLVSLAGGRLAPVRPTGVADERRDRATPPDDHAARSVRGAA